MKKRFKFDNSLIGIFFKYIILYTILIMVSVFLFDYFNYQNSLKYFKSIENIFKYQEYLLSESYDEIPKSSISGCNFIVFDDQGEVLYSTNYLIFEGFTYENSEVIIDYASQGTYQCYYLDYEDKTYLITLQNEDKLTNYALLDQDLNIIEGNLFKGKLALTNTELKLIQGNYFVDEKVEKCTYLTYEDQHRTLVFLSPIFDENQYLDQVQNQAYLELILYFLIILFMIFISYLLKRKLLKKIRPLNNAIENYKKGQKVKIDKNQILSDYQNIINNFETLIELIEKEKSDKQRIIADISHDLKTPLTTILGYASAINQGLINLDKRDYYTKSILEKAQKANELLNTLIDYSKINHPQYILNLDKKSNFNEFIREFIISNYQRIEDKEFNLDLEIEEEINEIYFDSQLLTRALDNLLENAFKYNCKGTTLLVKVKRQDNRILFYFGDNGIGISENIKNSIFEPFVTSNNARSENMGVGLGLSIVKKIIELHGWTIKLTQNKNYHTVFLITIPLEF